MHACLASSAALHCTSAIDSLLQRAHNFPAFAYVVTELVLCLSDKAVCRGEWEGTDAQVSGGTLDVSCGFRIRTTRSGCVVKRIPVSYTHLRAHETPEHLVCRLLL